MPNIVSGYTCKTNIKLEFMSLLSSKEQTTWWNSYPLSTFLPYPNINHRQVTEYGIRAVFLSYAFNHQNCVPKIIFYRLL